MSIRIRLHFFSSLPALSFSLVFHKSLRPAFARTAARSYLVGQYQFILNSAPTGVPANYLGEFRNERGCSNDAGPKANLFTIDPSNPATLARSNEIFRCRCAVIFLRMVNQLGRSRFCRCPHQIEDWD